MTFRPFLLPAAAALLLAAAPAPAQKFFSIDLGPVPAMTGMTFYQQWFVASSGGACQGVAVSNALEVTIQ